MAARRASEPCTEGVEEISRMGVPSTRRDGVLGWTKEIEFVEFAPWQDGVEGGTGQFGWALGTPTMLLSRAFSHAAMAAGTLL